MDKLDFGMPDFVWHTCKCGTKSTRVPCWDCVKREEEIAAFQHAERRKGIPARFGWASLSSSMLKKRVHIRGRDDEEIEPDTMAAVILAHAGPAVLFVGPAGSGKTSLAVACLRAVESPGVMYVPAASLERARIEHPAGRGEAPLVHRAMTAPLVLIDDLGQDKPTSISAIEAVLLERHNAELPTWVTTGLTESEIEARYGAGVSRRLTEKGTALVVRMVRP